MVSYMLVSKYVSYFSCHSLSIPSSSSLKFSILFAFSSCLVLILSNIIFCSDKAFLSVLTASDKISLSLCNPLYCSISSFIHINFFKISVFSVARDSKSLISFSKATLSSSNLSASILNFNNSSSAIFNSSDKISNCFAGSVSPSLKNPSFIIFTKERSPAITFSFSDILSKYTVLSSITFLSFSYSLLIKSSLNSPGFPVRHNTFPVSLSWFLVISS